MLELLDSTATLSAGDHWRFMWDTKNMLALQLAPVMAGALEGNAETRPMAEALRGWDFMDDSEAVAPTVFQAVLREFARLTFEDELGPEVAARMLENWYYWQERLLQLAADDRNRWFDDVATASRETRDYVLRRTAMLAREDLVKRLFSDHNSWRWGRLHTVTFFSPLVPGKWLAGILGGGTRPKDGSGETLNRAIYKYASPYETATIASMRFVADLADPDKVMAVLSGGASGRQFDPHLDDQLDAWHSGAESYWWFSDKAIGSRKLHGRSGLAESECRTRGMTAAILQRFWRCPAASVSSFRAEPARLIAGFIQLMSAVACGTRPVRRRAAAAVLASLGLTAVTLAQQAPAGREFPPGQLRALDELPASRLLTELQQRPAPVQARALQWLRSFHFTARDLPSLHADLSGAIFYVCQPDRPQEGEAAPSAPPAIGAAALPVDPGQAHR